MDYEVRSYRPGDEEQIVPLLQLVFDGWRDIDFWRWKYLDNPLKMNIIGVGVSNGRIIGVDGAICKRVKIGNRVFLSSYGTDAAVHPDFRRRGVYNNISILLKELRRNAGEEFNYFGTVNPIVVNYHIKTHPVFPYFLLTFSRILDIDLYNRMNPTKNISGHIKRLLFHAIKIFNNFRNILLGSKPWNEGIKISEIDEFDDRADIFWDEIKDHYDFIVERTREHLNWSYCDPRGGDFIVKLAEEDGRILGYVVLLTKDDGEYPRGEIMDLLTVPGRMDAADALMADATKVFDENKVNQITSQVVEGHPYEKLMERHGFIDVRRKTHVIYGCTEMDSESLRSLSEIIEKIDVGKVHLSSGDFI